MTARFNALDSLQRKVWASGDWAAAAAFLIPAATAASAAVYELIPARLSDLPTPCFARSPLFSKTDFVRSRSFWKICGTIQCNVVAGAARDSEMFSTWLPFGCVRIPKVCPKFFLSLLDSTLLDDKL